jgi:hypothetical protein
LFPYGLWVPLITHTGKERNTTLAPCRGPALRRCSNAGERASERAHESARARARDDGAAAVVTLVADLSFRREVSRLLQQLQLLARDGPKGGRFAPGVTGRFVGWFV